MYIAGCGAQTQIGAEKASRRNQLSGGARRLFCAVAMAAIGVTAWGQPAARDTKPNVDRASAYYHYTLAHMYAEMAATPGNTREYLNKSIENYKEAIKADPTTPLLTEELSELYIASGRFREAQSEAEEALKQNPNDANARRMLARIFTHQIGDQQNRIDETMLKKAIEQYQKIVELDPKDIDSLVMLGRLQKVAQNSGEAEKAYKKALAIDPDSEEALVGLATVMADSGDNNGAADILKKLAEKNPSQEALRKLASAYEQMKEFTLAADALNRALASNPPDAGDLKRAMADDLDAAKQYDAAIKVYQQLAEEEPKDAASYLRMSQIYREMRNFAMAKQMSEKARGIDPDNIEIRYNEVAVLEAEGKLPDAIPVMKDILASTTKRTYNPAERSVRVKLLQQFAAMYREVDQIEPAIEAYRQVADLNPDAGALVAAEIIGTYDAGKEFQKAEQEADAALKKWPDDRQVHLAHASLIADLGKTDAAAAEVKKVYDGKADEEFYLTLAQIYDKGRKFDDMAKALDSAEKLAQSKEEKDDIWFTRGAMFEKMKKNDAAEAEFKKILDVNPDSGRALNYLGYMLADRNTRLNDALQMIKKAVELEPNSGAYLDSLGWVYFRLGRLPEAEESIKKALAFTPRDATVHDHMGDILLRESKVKEAIAHWEISLKEWNAGSPADLEPAEVAKVKNKLDGAKVRLAREGSPKQDKQ